MYMKTLTQYEADYTELNPVDGRVKRIERSRDYSIPFRSIEAVEDSSLLMDEVLGMIWPLALWLEPGSPGEGRDAKDEPGSAREYIFKFVGGMPRKSFFAVYS